MTTKTIILTIFLSFFVVFANAQSAKAKKPKSKGKESNVPYLVAKNYFVSSNADIFEVEVKANPKITSDAVFATVFGMATTMGDGGMPTYIDFNKNYVIAILGETTNVFNEIMPKSLTQKGGIITLKYEVKKGEKLSYTMRTSLVLIVDKKYEGKVVLQEIKSK